MDMKIAGSGSITPGEYENICVSGSGKIYGPVRCRSLHASGSVSAEGDIFCEEEVHVSGSGRFCGAVQAGEFHAAGSAHVDGDLTVAGEAKAAGSFRCDGGIRAGVLRLAGGIRVEKDAEAEDARISGGFHCGGLLNAERVELCTDGSMDIGSIGGSVIRVRWESRGWNLRNLFCKNHKGTVTVRGAIEGDDILLECVNAPRVSGRAVVIGENCNIDLVQYSESIEISPDARVGRTEKV